MTRPARLVRCARMKFAVLRFPGSNCDQDCFHALRDDMGQEVEYVWHKTDSLAGISTLSWCRAGFLTAIICGAERLRGSRR